jgi:hypothetical protein
MEIIKKTILQAVTTGTTTGCTGTCRIIIPDTGATYNIKLLLSGEIHDFDFFDAYTLNTPYSYINIVATPNGMAKYKAVLSGSITLAASGLQITPDSGAISGTTVIPTSVIVTGHSQSRLSELRKYSVSPVFTNQYVTGGNYSTDGVDVSASVPSTFITYYLGGIRYIDVLSGATSGTTFRFTGQGTSSPDFINVPIYKNPNKENIISNPKINDDVFITRQELSAFDSNYRLEYIKNLVDLETYAAGKFFNIVNNT